MRNTRLLYTCYQQIFMYTPFISWMPFLFFFCFLLFDPLKHIWIYLGNSLSIWSLCYTFCLIEVFANILEKLLNSWEFFSLQNLQACVYFRNHERSSLRKYTWKYLTFLECFLKYVLLFELMEKLEKSWIFVFSFDELFVCFFGLVLKEQYHGLLQYWN